MIEFGHGTHVGLRRRCNEDTYYADPGLGLFLVADGLGGQRHGELASALARDAVVDAVRGGAALDDAILHADRRLLEHRSACSANAMPMGTTLAALRLSRDGFEAAWIGDSRLYLWQHALHDLSQDPEAVTTLAESGVVDAERSQTHPAREVATQALGVTPAADLRIARLHGRIASGMRFLLCSDGLVDGLTKTTIAATAGRDDLAAQERVDHLILAALDAGGADNASAVLVHLR